LGAPRRTREAFDRVSGRKPVLLPVDEQFRQRVKAFEEAPDGGRSAS
jgi:hypothetical protein